MIERNKFIIDDVVNNALNDLPKTVWTSSTTKFLDPAMAGGQIVTEIEERLRDEGHSDENIASRVFGYSTSETEMNYAIRMNDLVGSYEVRDFLTTDTHIENVIIITHPPVSPNNQSYKWNDYISKAMDISNTVLGIVPIALAQAITYQTLRKRINDRGLGAMKTFEYQYITGSTNRMLHFITDINAPKYNDDAWFDGQIKSIIEKIEAVVGPKYYNEKTLLHFKRVKRTTQPGNIIDKLTRQGIEYKLDVLDRDADKHRVVTSYLSNAKKCHLEIVESCQPGTGVTPKYRQLIVKNKTEAQNIQTYLKSKFCRALHHITKTSRLMDGVQTRFLPVVDFSRAWANKEIYDYFKLSQDDIDYLEKNI